MRSRLLGIAATLAMLAAMFSFTALDMEQDIPRYHQHLEVAGYSPCSDHGEERFCSHLPLIFIDTDGAEIPNTSTGVTAACTIQVMDSAGNHHLGDQPTLVSQGQIRIRGNSSRSFDKKGYLLRITQADGVTERDVEMMGMAAHDEWVLHGPFLDKSLIRNYMWYNIAGDLMDYAPNVRFCEAFINGEYAGLYLMVETITNGDNARLDFFDPGNGSRETGYVVRWDRGSDTPEKNIETMTQYTMRTFQTMDIVYPRGGNLTPKRIEYIQQEITDFEKALYSYRYGLEDDGYQKWIDVESFVDYFIINEFTVNYDVGDRSTYLCKDIRGKYKMCVWDFNNSCDNYYESQLTPQRFIMQDIIWYDMLIRDEDFVEALIARYRQLRETWLSDEALMAYIDGTVEWLGPAVERNFEVWGYTFDMDMLAPAERNPRSHAEAVQQLKTFCLERGSWMDESIDTLRQYCHPSKNKEFIR